MPDDEQNQWAKVWLDELSAEQKFDDKLANSLDVLDYLAAEAIQEHRQGKTRPLEKLLELDSDK